MKRLVIATLLRAGRADLANAVARHVVIALIVSPDSYVYTESGRYAWSPKRVKEAWRKSYAALKKALATGRYRRLVLMVGIPASGKSTWLTRNHRKDSIYFDATFTSTHAREPVVQIGKAAGVQVDAVIMNTPLDVCLERNKCRPADRRVPDEVIERMTNTLIGDIPTKREGFDNIEVVTYSG